MKTKTLKLLFLIGVIATALSVTAFAAIEPFGFALQNTGTCIIPCLTTSNVKVYQYNNASIKLDYTNAPGYGFRLQLGDFYDDAFHQDATISYWYHANNNFLYPAYYSGRAVVGRSYCVGGRIDNDYTGLYYAQGRFNADEVYIPPISGGY